MSKFITVDPSLWTVPAKIVSFLCANEPFYVQKRLGSVHKDGSVILLLKAAFPIKRAKRPFSYAEVIYPLFINRASLNLSIRPKIKAKHVNRKLLGKRPLH